VSAKEWRSRTALRQAAFRTVASWNPIAGSPAAALETRAALEAFGPSLMPRAALHQGMATGLSVLAARCVGAVADAGIGVLSGGSSSLRPRLAAAAAIAAAGGGLALARRPAAGGEPLAVSAARSCGWLLAIGAASSAAYDTATAIQDRLPGLAPDRRVVVRSLSSGAALVLVARRRLRMREQLVPEWTAEDKPAGLAASGLIAQGVVTAGSGLARAFIGTKDSTAQFFGPGLAHRAVANAVNAAGWCAGGLLAYGAIITYLGRANEKIEPGYATAPGSPLRSGSPSSKTPFAELGLQGRRYVTDVITPALIETTLGEPAKAEPIRTYVGFDTEPLYPNGRAEIALDELERTGAFGRSHLVLVSPTGTGWIDQTMIESAELFTRGDVATCAIQYGRFPSFLCTQKVPAARAQFRALLWGVKERLAAVPADRRPRVLVFGESLGAWASSDVTMRNGIAGLDEYGVDRALWFGLPGLAAWSKTGMKEGRSPLVPAGTVGHFDHYEQFAALSEPQRDRLRVVVVDHDDDPIALLSPRLAYARPGWLGSERGRGVPESMGWRPVITFVNLTVDAMNAVHRVPGQFKSFGHDYRADTARFVHAAFGLPAVTAEQMQAVERVLRELELDRAQRISSAKRAAGSTRAAGARWRRSLHLHHEAEPAPHSSLRAK
jgi:uncharacterized membrane protein